MLTRRRFMQSSALVAFAPMVPTFLSRMALAAGSKPDARVLVVIQMDGGNDGINTVVPFGDDGYARNRVALRLPREQLLKLNDHVGLHPSMSAAATLIEQGRLAIAQGVGYPNPNRSHFQSMAIWQTARLVESEQTSGWLGRALDEVAQPGRKDADAVYVAQGELPHALAGIRLNCTAMTSTEEMVMRLPVTGDAKLPGDANDVAAFVRRSMLTAVDSAHDIADMGMRTGASAAVYPNTKLATQLKLISQLIKSGAGTRIYYAKQIGYDTHGKQLPDHARLLEEFSGGLKALLDDLKSAGLSQRVAVVAFSEFGRRVAENSSAGTDHGTAGPVFIAGDSVRAGLIGPTPSLEQLEDGDLKIAIDFREIYASLLENWLQIPAKPVLAGDFAPAAIFRVG